MPIGVSRKRDERRRRVLRDERTGDDEQAEAVSRRVARRRRLRYGSAARRRHQPTLGDLLPISGRRYWLAQTLLFVVVASVTSLVWLLGEPTALAVAPRLLDSFFGVASRLAQWLAATLLLGSAVVAFQAFLVRRHRRDDYRGHYTLWLWGAFAMVGASADVSTQTLQNLGALLSQTLESVTAATLLEQTPRVLLTLIVGGRLAWEMREHRASTLILAIGIVTWIAMLATPLLLPEQPWSQRVLALSDLAGASLLTMAMLSHVRYIVSDAARGGRSEHGSESAESEMVDEGFESQPAAARSQRRRRTTESEYEQSASEKQDAVELPAVAKVQPRAARSAEPAPAPQASVKAAAETPVSRPASPAPTAPVASSAPPAASAPATGYDEDADDEEGDETDSASMAGMSKAQRKKLARAQRRAAKRSAA